jgi:acyl-CoA thioester hydrolase
MTMIDPATVPAPFTTGLLDIQPDWIDYNDHLNMAYYNVLFDRSSDHVWDWIGFGPAYIARTNQTTFAAEFHIRYLRELKLGDRVRGTFHLVDHDAKRFHHFMELRHEDGWLAATGEGMTLHVNLDGPRVVPMPDEILSRIAALGQAHAKLPRPEGIGARIGIRRTP